MEEKPDMQNHRISLTGRQFGMITGVSDVVSFDVTEIVLETEMGMLMIKGKDLHVNRLTLEKGEVDIEGMVDSLTYSEGGHHRQGDSLLGRLFK